MYCEKCGAKIKDDARYCNFCGAEQESYDDGPERVFYQPKRDYKPEYTEERNKNTEKAVVAEAPENHSNAAKNKKKTIIIICAAVAFCICVAIVLVLCLNGKKTETAVSEAAAEETTVEEAVAEAIAAEETTVEEAVAEAIAAGETAAEESSPANNILVGDYIIFGTYEQDNDFTNGKEDIEWLVLAKEGNKALVISRYVLDCQQYNTTEEDSTWETCSLRKWMNGAFLNYAFSAEEQAIIQSTNVSADNNPEYSTDPGNATTDKIFLLSIAEAKKYFSSDKDRRCLPTEYAIAQGAWTYDSSSEGGKATCWWLLRSPGAEKNRVVGIKFYGMVYTFGDLVNNDIGGVRPAMWINTECLTAEEESVSEDEYWKYNEDYCEEIDALIFEGAYRNYTREELENKNQWELCIIRNGMFAMSGKVFSVNPWCIEYFPTRDWYDPVQSDVREYMNDYQKENANFIAKIEKEKGWR